ncbi:MAG: penicillin-binding protein activator LpoB [Treponema sp.]|nr:penicillin-binding protein activator LpoB [Treponema sp.]
MKVRFFAIAVVLLSVLAFPACVSSSPGVKRVDAESQIDLSGYWNDTDVRIICAALIKDLLNSPEVDQAIKAKAGNIPGSKKTAVLVGRFRNESDEHIDTAIIASIMEAEIFKSGKMDFVAGGLTRDEIRAERQDQQSNASEATAAALAKETGADFLLTGAIRTIIDRAGNKTVRTYFVNAEMSNIETNQRIWMGQNSDIKKTITRAKTKF